ncbi:hypothetical protein LOTGIDRAFT_170945 [Lottia gigantea]|uniref:Uncharacterized protein n=1 Tax=Lottia gigantea TaxID=225164 RepID=V4CPA1_LOTGI|nr:hypothetical protein LOTGIDRAFT_170945 [Lottia gigantea]ESP04250.1 hypothetical protein LOTGIDRAFT_170945 [Lottia gigantea]
MIHSGREHSFLIVYSYRTHDTSSSQCQDLRSNCPDGWLEERDQCYRPIPSCLSLFSNEEKEAFCRAVLGADIGYVNGVLSCVSDLRIPDSVLMQILEPKSGSSLSKRVFGNSGFGR